MVRLKQVPYTKIKKVYTAFQFHHGAIKAIFLYHIYYAQIQFQFHHGAIKASINQWLGG